MRHTILLSSFLLSITGALAQQITNVVVSPSPLHACETAIFNVMGTGPAGLEFTFVNTMTSTDSIILVIEASGSGSGSSAFNNEVAGTSYAEGEYGLSISLEYNGTITSTWTGSLTVLPPDIPDVGEANSINVCPNAAPFTLLSQLNGTPDAGGVWLNPQLAVVSDGMFVPGVSVEGGYQYYFDVLPPCQPEYQSLMIQYNPNTSAGNDTTVSLCSVTGPDPVDLFTLLDGNPDAGGTWSGGTGGIYTPGVSDPGDYIYTVTGMPPCADPTATVTVIGAPASDAGTGGEGVYCFDETEADLSALLSGADESGYWYSPDGTGVASFTNQVNVAAYGPGVYSYVVEAAPCPADTAFVTVVLDGPPCTLGIAAVEHTAERMLLSPNPATDKVIIEIEGAQPGRDQYIELSDVNGKVVLRRALNGSSTTARKVVDLSKLAPGAYTVKLVGGAGVAAQRLMVR